MDVAASAAVERGKLRRELGRFDAVCLLIAAIVVLDTLGAVARGGAETITWLAVVSLLFFVPAGLAIAELGAAFPHQGGPYVWARMAFGRFAGSLVALCYWVEAAVWVGGSLAITAVAVIDELVVPLDGYRRVVVALVFVAAATMAAVVPLATGRRIPAVGAAVQVGLLAFFTATVVAYAVREGIHDVAAGDVAPSWSVFVLVAPVLVYNFLGFELPSAAGEEMRDPQRDVPAAIGRAGALTFVLYCVPVLAIVLVMPAEEISGLTGFIDAISSVFIVYGSAAGSVGAAVGSAFVLVLLVNGMTWMAGSSRAQAAASLDGVGPEVLARISHTTGTPVRATVAAGAAAIVTTSAAFAVAGNDNEKYFSVVLALSIALLALANLAVFPALMRLRRSHPDVPRPFRVPGRVAGAWSVSGIATAWTALAFLAVLWPGLGTADPGAHLPDGFGGDRLGFVLIELVPLAAVVGAAALFARRGRKHVGQRSGELPPACSGEASHAWPASQNERKSQWVHHRPGVGSNAPSPIAVSDASTRSRTTAGSSIGFEISSPLARYR
jgi:amino acid transporter